jgi:SAM-dependent methyltransferase
MHAEQQRFFNTVKHFLPEYFYRTKVIDFGSLDINGNNRHFFEECEYTGVDLYQGRNVDIVGLAHEVELPYTPDVIISGEMLEHDRYWKKSLQRFQNSLTPQGLLLISCATVGRPEHGTHGTDVRDSPGTPDYYKNLTEEDFRNALDMSEFFKFGYLGNATTCDLYFWGVKN